MTTARPEFIFYLDSALRADAERLASRLGLSCLDATSVADSKAKHVRRFIEESTVGVERSLVFILDVEGLRLQTLDAESLRVRVDFCDATVTYRRQKGGGVGQMIAKAVGVKSGVRPCVLDCTAGMGGDAFVLASLGCRVQMLERVPEVAALLEDGLYRASKYARDFDADLAEVLVRMEFIKDDANKYLESLEEAILPDVIYLDPMFPARSKSALVKQEMRIFHQLVGSDLDADDLLVTALNTGVRRIVVKRPRQAAYLAGRVPHHQFDGKRNRFDVYTV